MTRWLRRPAVVDGVFLFALCTIALAGFHDVFAGWSFLAAGLAGLILGLALAIVAASQRQSVIVLAVLLVGAFFLLGGPIALHGLGSSYLLPLPKNLAQLADVSLHGWKQLVTTLPPTDGPLLAIPYLIGLVGGGAGLALAKHVRWAGVPLLVPFAVLVLVISLGVTNPTHVAVLAAAFVGAAIAWAVLRSHRTRLRTVGTHSRRLSRRVVAIGLCVGAAALSVVMGPHWPDRQDRREVFRAHVFPPLNVEQYPSPLVEFRRFTSGYKLTNPQDELNDKVLFQVSGLPAGATMRLAALDSYDGDVWGAGNVAGSDVSTPGDPDTFQKVGHVIKTRATGTRASATVKIEDGAALGVWVPVAGQLTGLDFGGARSCGDGTYYNLTSATAVVTDGLAACDSYSFSTVVSNRQFSPTTPLASGALDGVSAATQFQQTAAGIAGRSADPAGAIKSLATYLQDNGHKTDGEGGFAQYGAGHSLYRLQLFMSTQGQLAGDEEQFSAVLALLANDLNIPARVVVGVQSLPAGGSVHGSDVSAWVEVQAQDGSWEDVPASMFMPIHPPQPQNPQPQTNKPAANIPPPAPVHPPASAGQPFNDALSHRPPTTTHIHSSSSVWVIVGYIVIPLAIIVAIGGGIVGLKAFRRRRRRTSGTPTRRLLGAWNELLDLARDHGHRAPVGATRRQQAKALGITELSESARRADNTMFGRADPSAADVAAFWEHVDEVRKKISDASTRWTRLRARFNIVTLRPRRLSRA